ncbi:MAG: gamma-glutamyl-gamma-aminobutyrate hydrolase family protein, partial [Thermoleophilaceae bacterium]|nr:gamma-glutamyl-gamma-aminobutyrate hydrolase family protein [Thermoleophilaceae bacterium]
MREREPAKRRRGVRGAREDGEPAKRRRGVRGARAPRVLIIDNYDSFTYNLVQYVGELGAKLEVVRNDSATVDELLGRGADRLIVSPGPCTPAQAGVSVEAIRRFAEARTPVLGVCLGHQALASAFGGVVVRGEPVHGKVAPVEHDG